MTWQRKKKMLKRLLKKITTKGKPLTEINIYGFNHFYDKESATYGHTEVNIGGGEHFKALLKELYDKILYKDKRWHFFVEGEFNHLRVSPEYEDDVINFLFLKMIDYKDVQPWEDASPIVRAHKEEFEQLFHAYSLLGLDDLDEGIANVADRVIHCFFNMQYFNMKEIRKNYGGKAESVLIAHNLIARSYYQGNIDGIYTNNLKHQDDIQELKAKVKKYGSNYEELFEKYDELVKKFEAAL